MGEKDLTIYWEFNWLSARLLITRYYTILPVITRYYVFMRGKRFEQYMGI